MAIIPEYLRLEQELRDRIVKGKIQVGDRLPDEYTLAEQLNTSRPTLRKALNILASEGFLKRIPGRGTFIASPNEQKSQSFYTQYRYFKKMNKGIGVLVPSIHIYLGAGIVCGAEQRCWEQCYHVLLGNYEGDPKKEKEYLDLFKHRGVSGIVSFAGFTSDAKLYLNFIHKGNVPLVFAGSGIEEAGVDIVKTDNIISVSKSVEELIAEGYRNIGFASIGMQSISARERFIGYREALYKAGLTFYEDYIFTQHAVMPEEEEIKRAVEMLKNTKIDALFVANEYTSITFVKAIKQINDKRISNLRIVGMDKPDFFDFSGYNISFIYQPAFKIGMIAADLLIDRIEKRMGDVYTPKKILLPAEKEETLQKHREVLLKYSYGR